MELFKVSYTGLNPKIVRDYINTLISIYVEGNTSAQREETNTANKFLSEQIAHYKNKVDEAEGKLTRFRHEKGLYYSSDEESMLKSIRDYKNGIEQLKISIETLEAKKEKIRQQLSGEKPLTLIMLDQTKTVENDPMSNKIRLLQNELDILMATYTDSYPEVIRIRAELELLQKQSLHQEETQIDDIMSEFSMPGTSGVNPVYQQLKEELFNTESDIDSKKATVVSLSNRIKQMKTYLENIPEDNKVLSNFERDRETYKKIYEQLISRLGQAEVSKQMELENKAANFRVVDPALMPTNPISPDRVKLIILGIIAGIAAGIGVILLLDYINHSIKDVEILKADFKMPVLAVIPTIIVEEDIIKARRLDKTVYSISIAYLSVIGGLFIKELIGKF
jgi:polysaccharide chain length determinant protein (PEP-CTERM system associated)